VPRPHIEFIRVQDVEPTPCPAPFTGLAERRLSTDGESGASTSVVAFDRGWRGEPVAGSRPLELFLLAGALALDGRALGPGCYVHVPSGATGVSLEARDDALALVMVEDERTPAPGESPTVVDSELMEYAPSSVVGLVIKKLRVDPETGDWTWLAASAPNRVTPRAEIHPTVEEAFLLRGDCLLGGRGEMTPGSYFWRPPMVEHGPIATRNGTFFFFRTKGGGLETTYVEVPGWEQAVQEYRAAEPYYRG